MGERAAARAASFARSAGGAAGLTSQLHDLEGRLDRMLLVMHAMWSLLQEQGYEDIRLAERIRVLDEEDGVLDGIRRARPVRCTKCDSMVEAERPTCTICGSTMPKSDSAF